MKNFGNIKYRSDIKAYITEKGFMVPHPDDETVPIKIHTQMDSVWYDLDAYAKEHPEKVTEELPEVSSEPTLGELKAAKLAEINSTYDSVTFALVARYPLIEVLTFDQQEFEARAWEVDNSAETRLVDKLAEGRQMDKAELIRRIIVKADAFKLTTGYLTGQRHRYEDLLDTATTVEQVEAIEPKYMLPEA